MEAEKVHSILVRKYNQPVPWYTSYPTVPFWKEEIDVEKWKTAFRNKFEEQNHTNGISLYLHLPFCESLCTYCGCNKKLQPVITTSTKFLLGLGVSSISDTGNAFAQNNKTIREYYESVSENKLPIKKGYFFE
jgi:coproporphyrinogen III oxidase-like Fe-S oxidoreductase